MVYDSAPKLLVLHAVRILGMSDKHGVARRFALDPDTVEELLLDGMLADELGATGTRPAVEAAYQPFIQLNSRLLTLLTRWQIRPEPWDPMARNDHSGWTWDEDVLKSLAHLAQNLRPVGDQLANTLSRFASYPDRFSAALDRVNRGERKWVDEPKIDSCHTVWFELHEDLLATLGLDRGDGG